MFEKRKGKKDEKGTQSKEQEIRAKSMTRNEGARQKMKEIRSRIDQSGKGRIEKELNKVESK